MRPAPLMILNPIVPTNNLVLDKRVILSIFKYLTSKELLNCALGKFYLLELPWEHIILLSLFDVVCKTWATYSIDPSLWKHMEFDHKKISSDMLKGTVRRQPEILSLNWCRINHFQLPWLIQRLNNLKQLYLQSIDVKSAISLRTNHSAVLQVLDLSFISDFNDSALREILGKN